MPVIRDISLSLNTREVLRWEGVREHTKIRPEVKSLVLELLTSVKKTHLLEPAVIYEIYSITEMGQQQLSQEGNPVVLSLLLPSLLPGAKKFAIVVGTIGAKLEKQATDYFDQNEPLRGILLDGIGSAAMDSLTDEAHKLIAYQAKSHGYQASSPISPGMPCLPIAGQRQLFRMVPAREIGVSLTSAGVMIPRKSISMVIGIGPKMMVWTRAEVCADCNLKRTCAYRIQIQIQKRNIISV